MRSERCALLKLGFPVPASRLMGLRRAMQNNSLAHSSIGTASLALCARKSQITSAKSQTNHNDQNNKFKTGNPFGILKLELEYCLEFRIWSLEFPCAKHKLRVLVSIWFQVLFHPPSGVLFTFPSRY